MASPDENSEDDRDYGSGDEDRAGVDSHPVATAQTSRPQPEERGVPLGWLANAPNEQRGSYKSQERANHEADRVVHAA
jgi:hypothetical protein